MALDRRLCGSAPMVEEALAYAGAALGICLDGLDEDNIKYIRELHETAPVYANPNAGVKEGARPRLQMKGVLPEKGKESEGVHGYMFKLEMVRVSVSVSWSGLSAWLCTLLTVQLSLEVCCKSVSNVSCGCARCASLWRVDEPICTTFALDCTLRACILHHVPLRAACSCWPHCLPPSPTPPSAAQNIRMCEHCCKVAPKTKIPLCEKCGHAAFCSSACSTAAWPVHKPRCRHVRDMQTGKNMSETLGDDNPKYHYGETESINKDDRALKKSKQRAELLASLEGHLYIAKFLWHEALRVRWSLSFVLCVCA